jgi:hypothetical protein
MESFSISCNQDEDCYQCATGMVINKWKEDHDKGKESPNN